MKPKLLANHNVGATVLRLVAVVITSTGITLGQQPPPVAPAPVSPPGPVAPVPPVTTPRAGSAPPAALPPPVPVPAPVPPLPAPAIQPPLSPSAGLPPLPDTPVRTLTRTILDDELNADPQAGAKNYETIISNFDRQREAAAQAIFRLGESYRRMGRIEEARSMYARILREFVDFPDLAKLSQQLLANNAPTQVRESVAWTTTAPNPAEEAFIREELKLLEEQLANAKALTETGQAPTSSLLPIKREILQLRQRLARAQAQDGPPPTAAITGIGGGTVSAPKSYRRADSQNEPDRLKTETRELETQIALISGRTPPEAMSTQVIKDPRFVELKNDYEKRFLSASNDKDSIEALANARERLAKWIREIYLPELESTLVIKRAQLEEIVKRSELEQRSMPVKR